MKFSNAIFALCVFQSSVVGSAAFFQQAPQGLAFRRHTDAESRESLALKSSYLENLNKMGQQPSEARVFEQQKFDIPVTTPEAPAAVETSQLAVPEPQAPPAVATSQLAVPEPQAPPAPEKPKNIFESTKAVTVQGASLRTWSFSHPAIERVQVLLTTAGRPLNANIELWQGPDNTPQIMRIYSEDGKVRPFRVLIQTPKDENAIAVRNTAEMEFPLIAISEADIEGIGGGLQGNLNNIVEEAPATVIQGGALKTFSFDSTVNSVQLMLQTDGRPMNARIELLQGPNNNKQVIELYTENGRERPFFAILETPGTGNVVRVLNTAPLEFPLSARAEPYVIKALEEYNDAIMVSNNVGDWHGNSRSVPF